MENFLIFALLGCLLHTTSSYRILGVIPFTGKSHYISMQPLFQALAERGHDVTVISYFEEKDPLPNYHQIIVKMKTFWEIQGDNFNIISMETMPFEDFLKFVWDGITSVTNFTLAFPAVQDFIKNDTSHFDLVITELFSQEAFLMFGHKYQAPVIGLATFGFTQFIGSNMGNPVILPYMTHEFLRFGKILSFRERMTNMYSTAYDLFWRKYYLIPKHQKLAEKYFKDLPGPLPQVAELEKNISAVFLNTHFSTETVRPYVPGIIEIGGSHIKMPKKLPEDIQKILDGAADGVIYFSLGSNVQSTSMTKDKIDIFLKVFGKIKQRVLWKWEDDQLEGKPNNVFISKWLPQNDILAHPNVKGFITHGGLLSIQETLFHGIPIIGLPFYGDQNFNLVKVESLGYGIKLGYSTLTEEKLEHSLNEILYNPKYSTNAKMLSSRFKDRPQTPMETAIFWTEYVIRNKGARFMRSPASDLSYFELHMLDIGILVSLLLTLLLTGMTLLFIASKRLCKSSKKTNINKKKNN